MYLHIGNDTVVKTNQIIVILDRKLHSSSNLLQEYLESKDVTDLSNGSFKSIIVTVDKIYLSPLGTGILKKKTLIGGRF